MNTPDTVPIGRLTIRCLGVTAAARSGTAPAPGAALTRCRPAGSTATSERTGRPLPTARRIAGGVDPTLEGRGLQDALREAIATRSGYCSWDVDHAGWVVTLDAPERHEFYGKTLEEALAWCLVWLMTPELGVGPFQV